MRILIVDDEAEIRKVLTILLENSGYEVVSASDGLSAVMTLRGDSEIDLCIMDVMMPRMDGIRACEEIRRFSSIPILFLTARSLEEDKELYAEVEKKVRASGDKLDLDMKEDYTDDDDEDDSLFDVKIDGDGDNA